MSDQDFSYMDEIDPKSYFCSNDVNTILKSINFIINQSYRNGININILTNGGLINGDLISFKTYKSNIEQTLIKLFVDKILPDDLRYKYFDDFRKLQNNDEYIHIMNAHLLNTKNNCIMNFTRISYKEIISFSFGNEDKTKEWKFI